MNRRAKRIASRILEILLGISVIGLVLVKITGGLRCGPVTMEHTTNFWQYLAVLLPLRLALELPQWTMRCVRAISRNKRSSLMVVMVTVVAAGLRLYNLSANSLNIDELSWIDRGRTVYHRLEQGKILESTKNLGHPGVIQAVLIGSSYEWLGKDTAPGSLGLMDPVSAARLPIAVLGVIACVALFVIGRRIWGEAPAFLGGLFLALDPVHISLSRMAHVDSTLALFFLLTVLTYVVGETERKVAWKAAAAVMFGCALLAKAPAFVLPAVLLVWKASVWVRDSNKIEKLFDAGDILCVMGGYIIYATFFGYLWATRSDHWAIVGQRFLPYKVVSSITGFLHAVPLAEAALIALLVARCVWVWKSSGERNWKKFLFDWHGIWSMMGTGVVALLVLRVFQRPIDNTFILMARLTDLATVAKDVSPETVKGSYNTSVTFYPFLISVRLTELLLASAVIGLFLCLWRYAFRKTSAAASSAALIPPFSFLILMSFSRRMAMRYIIPMQPFLCVMGGIGLAAVVTWILGKALRGRKPRNQTTFYGVCMALLILGHLPALIRYYPNCYLYYNSLIGGARGAAKEMVVGWGEGYKEVTAALKRIVGDRPVNVSVMGECGVVRYYWANGEPKPKVRAAIQTRPYKEADYLIVMLNKFQRRHDDMYKYARQHEPLETVNLSGVDIAWIYPHEREAVKGKETYYARQREMDWEVGGREKDRDVSGWGITAKTSDDPAGWLVRGPYRTYRPGKYTATFTLRVDGEGQPETEVGFIDVAREGGETVFARRPLRFKDFLPSDQKTKFELPFELEDKETLEFRVYFSDAVDLWFYKVKTEAIE